MTKCSGSAKDLCKRRFLLPLLTLRHQAELPDIGPQLHIPKGYNVIKPKAWIIYDVLNLLRVWEVPQSSFINLG